MNAVEDAAHSAAARAYLAKFMVVLRIDGIYGDGIEIYSNNNDVFSVGPRGCLALLCLGGAKSLRRLPSVDVSGVSLLRHVAVDMKVSMSHVTHFPPCFHLEFGH